jgi:hypothetical protein
VVFSGTDRRLSVALVLALLGLRLQAAAHPHKRNHTLQVAQVVAQVVALADTTLPTAGAAELREAVVQDIARCLPAGISDQLLVVAAAGTFPTRQLIT